MSLAHFGNFKQAVALINKVKPLTRARLRPAADLQHHVVCIGCTVCAKACPTDAIAGERKQLHVIDPDKCIKCGKCFTVCRFDAVVKN